MANRAFGLAAFTVAAIGGVALGFVGERKLVQGPDSAGDTLLDDHLAGAPLDVVSPDGTRIRAQVSGNEDGTNVLLVHGMALGQEAWQFQRQALEESCRVITFDLRGHGQSDPGADGDYSIGVLADDVIAVLQAIATPNEPVVLVGHSIGGMSVLAALRHHPEIMAKRVSGLGLVSTAGGNVVGSILAGASAVGASMLQSAVINSAPAAWLRGRLNAPRGEKLTDISFILTRFFGLSPSASAEVIAFVDLLNRRAPAAVLGALAQTLTTVDELDLLAGVTVPALVIVGELDRLTPPAQAERLVDGLANVDFVRIPDAGHTVMLEQPEQVSKALLRLVDRATERPT